MSIFDDLLKMFSEIDFKRLAEGVDGRKAANAFGKTVTDFLMETILSPFKPIKDFLAKLQNNVLKDDVASDLAATVNGVETSVRTGLEQAGNRAREAAAGLASQSGISVENASAASSVTAATPSAAAAGAPARAK